MSSESFSTPRPGLGPDTLAENGTQGLNEEIILQNVERRGMIYTYTLNLVFNLDDYLPDNVKHTVNSLQLYY